MSDPDIRSTRPGKVVVAATPIGNLDDVSDRLRQALAAADLVACEDTRRTGRLLAHLGLQKRMVSMHDHNERRRLPQILRALEEGQTVAVVSDAGTPLLSDPGYLLVRDAAARGLRIEPIPGPSAVLTALVASALPPHPFTFLGFPPPRAGRRARTFAEWRALRHTLVFFESPHRIVASLGDLGTALGATRPAAVCRELTKLHEEVLRGTLAEVHAELAGRAAVKGELVVVVDNRSGEPTPEEPD